MRTKGLLPILTVCFLFDYAVGQSALIKPTDRKILAGKEDSLLQLARTIYTDEEKAARMKADSHLTRMLVRALQVPHSYHYPFDSLSGISKLYSPDSTFRILTWNLQYDEYYNRQRGSIQLRTKDGSLRLFPLRDVSEFVNNPTDSVRGRSNWIGAVYYNIIQTVHAGKNYYTLFGLDPNNARSTMKWIEVMHFNAQNEPIFGGPFFTYENDSTPKQPAYRIHLEFKKDARVLANFIPELNMILVDHLISENDDPENKWTYIPDGDQEGYEWKNGRWVHIDKVFTLKLKDGEAPREVPLDKKMFKFPAEVKEQ